MGEQIENAAIGFRALGTTLLQLIGWYDPTRRRVLIRGALAVLGYLLTTGTITIPPWVYDLLSNPALAAVVAAIFIPAGQQNPATHAMLEDLRSAIDVLELPADKKAVLVAILDAQRPRVTGDRPA